jgi:hypothetical protein
MENRLLAIMTELEDINYILQNACVDRSILQLLGKLGEGDPEFAVNEADRLLYSAYEQVDKLIMLITGEKQ